jgi:hypothetical protein
MAGFNAFYFSTHHGAPLDAFDAKASQSALASGALAAAASSVALALKFRAAASAFVVVIWSVVIFGTAGARLFVKPGPEYFERHLGQQVFSVPCCMRLPDLDDSPKKTPMKSASLHISAYPTSRERTTKNVIRPAAFCSSKGADAQPWSIRGAATNRAPNCRIA